MDNRKIDSKLTKQVVIDNGYHQMAKIKATKLSISIKTYLEGLIIDDQKDETTINAS